MRKIKALEEVQEVSHLIYPRIKALFQLIRIATQHVTGSSFLFQNTCADANFFVSDSDCLHTDGQTSTSSKNVNQRRDLNRRWPTMSYVCQVLHTTNLSNSSLASYTFSEKLSSSISSGTAACGGQWPTKSCAKCFENIQDASIRHWRTALCIIDISEIRFWSQATFHHLTHCLHLQSQHLWL